MSIERCHIHDRDWDSDFHDECPACAPVRLTRQQVAEAFEGLCCDRPQGCEGVLGVDGYCQLAKPLDALFVAARRGLRLVSACGPDCPTCGGRGRVDIDISGIREDLVPCPGARP